MAAQIPEGAVIITPTEMYRQMEAVHHDVIEVKGMVSALTKARDDQEIRLRGVEKRVVWMSAAAFALGALGGNVDTILRTLAAGG